MDDKSFKRAVAAIKDDRTSGAGALSRDCLALLSQSAASAPAKSASELQHILNGRAAELAAARPSMAPIGNLVGWWRASIEASDTSDTSDVGRLRAIAAQAAEQISAESETATARAAARASEYIHEILSADQMDQPSSRKPAVLTLSWSGVVAEALAGLRGLEIEVVVAESRPLNEGADLARYLAEHGLSVTLITDAQLALFAEQVDMALCGADTLFADGAVLNKVGTRSMALAMADAGRPFITACESFKILPAPNQGTEDDIAHLEEMPDNELGYGASPPFKIRNVYFEVTPARLITSWCTEKGVAHDPAGLKPASRSNTSYR